MAKVVRGVGGKPHESPVVVRKPRLNREHTEYLVDYGPVIEFSVANGEQVTIEFADDEALDFLAKFAERLAIRVNGTRPPAPRAAKRVEGGELVPIIDGD